jgi:hypothetical protein
MELPDLTKIPFMRGVGAFAFTAVSVAPPFLLYFLIEPGHFLSYDIFKLSLICLSWGIALMLINLQLAYLTLLLFSGMDFNEKFVPLTATALCIGAYFAIFSIILVAVHGTSIPTLRFALTMLVRAEIMAYVGLLSSGLTYRAIQYFKNRQHRKE